MDSASESRHDERAPGNPIAESPERQIARLQHELHLSRERFRAIINKTADGVIILSPEGVIRFVNPAAESLLGREADCLLGEVFGMPAVPGETTEIDILRPEGPTRVAEMRIVETDWHGEIAHLASLRDITEHKRNEQEAQEAVRRRDRFLAMLSHELRNPLAAVVSASQLIERCSAEQATVEQSNTVIQRQCSHMVRLLDDLLEVSRMLKGKIELRREPLDLVDVVEDAVAAMMPVIQQYQHRLTTHIACRPIYVQADPARLHQILVNLLTNASKYCPRGGELHLVLEQDQHWAILRIRDNGIGIDQEMLESIFEPFVQLNHTLARHDVGLGIGLTLVKQLVELHQGRVTAHSDGPDQGCEFVIHLPTIEFAAPSATQPAAPPVHGSLSVVVVEDNTDSRQMLRTLLELDGYTVQTAEDGQAGYELIEFQRPDIALVDVGLPKLDGYEVAQQLRANRDNDGIYLIALTGYGQPHDRRRALQAGFDTHLVKPIDLELLYRLIAERRLHRNGHPSPVAQANPALKPTD